MLLVLSGLYIGRAYADAPRVQNRSLRIGTSEPGATTEYTFSWRWPTNSSVGSIRFLVCSDAYVEDPCSATPDADMSAATLSSQSGSLGGFGISSQAANEIILSRGSAGATGTGQYTFVFANVVNPTVVEHRFFVHILTYSSTDASGTAHHMSAVANAVTTPIAITTKVPPILFFCAGLTVTEWCEDVSGNFIDYGDLAPYVTDYGTSQFGVATNAQNGYVVTVNGNTMASGNKLITPIESLAPNSPGVGQFGLNLRANTDPPAGADVTGAGVGVVAADYDTPDLFLFRDGDTVATAATGTMFNTYTATYIVNIDPDQPSGIYNTTIAYICTAAF